IWPAADAIKRLYALPEKEFLRAFRYHPATGHVEETPAMSANTIRIARGMPGGALSVSSNGVQDGILWASYHDADAMMAIQPGHLVALDALTLRELWREDGIQNFAKFVPPMVADGNVYLATWGKPTSPDVQVEANLVVYGLVR